MEKKYIIISKADAKSACSNRFGWVSIDTEDVSTFNEVEKKVFNLPMGGFGDCIGGEWKQIKD